MSFGNGSPASHHPRWCTSVVNGCQINGWMNSWVVHAHSLAVDILALSSRDSLEDINKVKKNNSQSVSVNKSYQVSLGWNHILMSLVWPFPFANLWTVTQHSC